MHRVKHTAALGIATGALGCVIIVTSFNVERTQGLRWLFLARGSQPIPPEVVIITINRKAASTLGQSNKLREWSRLLHAKLISKLVELNVAVIVFDVLFESARDAAEDDALVKTVAESKRVVLAQAVQRRWLDRAGREILDPQVLRHEFDGMVKDTLVSPFPALTTAACGLAPFPLSKAHDRIHQFWSFFNGASQTPTLPVDTLLLYALRITDTVDLGTLLEADDTLRHALSNHQNAQALGTLSGHLYEHLKNNPALVDRVLTRLRSGSLSPQARKALTALIRVYSSHHDYYITRCSS